MSRQLIDQGTGPGGVGRVDGQSALRLWLKADADVTTSGQRVLQWDDQSGYGHNAVQLVPPAQPTMVAHNPAFNSMPTVRFNGQANFLRVNHSPALSMTQAMTAFVVIKPSTLNQHGGLFAKYKAGDEPCNYALYLHAEDERVWFEHYNQQWWRSWSGQQVPQRATILAFAFDAMTGEGAFGFDGQFAGKFNNKLQLQASPHPLEIGVHQRCEEAGFWFAGDMAELILYDGTINIAQRVIIENYLSAKYGISLAATRRGRTRAYKGSRPQHGEYTLDVVGLGREPNGTSAAGHSAGLTVIDRTFLKDDGDYLFFGHKSPQNGITTIGLPPEVSSRWERQWFFDLTDVGDNSGDLTLIFDCAAADDRTDFSLGDYLLLRRANETTPFEIVSRAKAAPDGTVSFNVSTRELSGRYYTLGRITSLSIWEVVWAKILQFIYQQQQQQPMLLQVNRKKQLTQRRTTHEQRHFDLVARNEALHNRSNLTPEEIQQALTQLLDAVADELPPESLALVQRVQQAINMALPHIADINSADHAVYVIRETALSYLPETLENYLNLPPAFANDEPLKQGKTARQLLHEQLTLLAQEMEAMAKDFHQRDAQRLLAHGRFLEDRFGSGDSLLL